MKVCLYKREFNRLIYEIYFIFGTFTETCISVDKSQYALHNPEAREGRERLILQWWSGVWHALWLMFVAVSNRCMYIWEFRARQHLRSLAPVMMMSDDNDDQMIFGGLGGLKLPNICLIGEEKPRKNLTQETCPDRGSNRGPLRDRRACYHLVHSGGRF